MKKLLLSYIFILCFVLAGCGSAAPKDVVNEFLEAVKNNDWEKASTYIDGESEDIVDELLNDEDEEMAKKILSAISKSFKYEKATEEKIDGDNATVTVNVTSVDMSVAFTSTMAEVMPMAIGLAFSEDEAAAEEQIGTLTENALMKHITDENATLATRDVTLNLTKNDDGDYLIIADENLEELILANMAKLDSFLNE